jgi:hypothetical protein
MPVEWAAFAARERVRVGDNETDVKSQDCLNMARVCLWKAGTAEDPALKEKWLDLARRWRKLAAEIEAGLIFESREQRLDGRASPRPPSV